MNFLIKKAAVLSFIVLTFFACEKPTDIGLDIKNPGQSFGVLFTDTVTVQTSTVLVDSVRTSRVSDNAHLLAGRYADPQLGTISTNSFFQIYPAREVIDFGQSPSVDSVVLFLRRSYAYGDTLSAQSLAVHLLEDSIKNTRITPYYSTDNLPKSVSVGSAEYNHRTDDTLKFILNNSIGDRILALNGQGEVALREAFYGFALAAGEGSGASVVAFNALNPASRLRVYYKNAASQTTVNVFDFGIDGNYTFNQVSSTRIAPWDNLAAFQPVPSTATSGETLVEGGTGIMTKVDIPHLLKLNENRTIRINQAYLIVQPVESKTGSTTPVPAQLILYRSDANDRPARNTSGIYIPVEEFNDFSRVGSPRLTFYNTTDKIYRFNITQYLQRILDNRETINPSIYLSLPSFSLDALYPRNPNTNAPSNPIVPASSLENSVSRVILGGQQHPTNALKLQIYYTEIK
jgi:hypothetical protein